MTIGFQPIRGNWEIRQINTASAATFGQFSPVDYDGHRDLIEATSASTQILGIALHSSVNSLPAGKVLVAFPRDNSAVFRAQITTNVAASTISAGQIYGIKKSGNTLMIDESSVATALVQISDPANFDSATSLIDATFIRSIIAQPSHTSITNP